jgi:hypothetical protein
MLGIFLFMAIPQLIMDLLPAWVTTPLALVLLFGLFWFAIQVFFDTWGKE